MSAPEGPTGSASTRSWLVKEEPTSYSFDNLLRDGATEWDGVHNALALRHLREMRPGDTVVIYHTGNERAAVGLAVVDGRPHPDPADDRGSWSVRVRAVRPLANRVPLSRLSGEPAFAASPLVRIGRLSVLELTPAQRERLIALSETAPPPPSRATVSAPGSGRAGARRSARRAGRRTPPRARGSGVGARSRARRRRPGTGR